MTQLKSSLDTIVIDSADLSTTFNTGGMDLTPYSRGSFQLIYDYATGTSAGSIVLQTSSDGTNYDDYPSATFNFTSSSTSDTFEFTSIGFKYLRFAITNASGSGGTLTIKAHLIRTGN